MPKVFLVIWLFLLPVYAFGKEIEHADGLFNLPTVCGSRDAIEELNSPTVSPERAVELMNTQCRQVEPSTTFYVRNTSGRFTLVEMYKLNFEPKVSRQSLGSWWMLSAEVKHYAFPK